MNQFNMIQVIYYWHQLVQMLGWPTFVYLRKEGASSHPKLCRYGGGCEAAVAAITRFVFIKLRYCGELLFVKGSLLT